MKTILTERNIFNRAFPILIALNGLIGGVAIAIQGIDMQGIEKVLTMATGATFGCLLILVGVDMAKEKQK